MTAANAPQAPKSATRATNRPGVGPNASVRLTEAEREFLRDADLGRKFRMNELHIARVESLIAARVEAALAPVREVCEQVEADDRDHLDAWGQHLPGSVVVVAEMIRAALDRQEGHR